MSMIDEEFAQQLVNLIYQETSQNANLFGEDGIIIASTVAERIGTVHEGAREIMSGKVDSIAITEETAMQMSGVRPGYNVGIDTQNQRIGAIGISGNPDEMRPIAMIACRMVVLEYERKDFINHLNAMASDINKSLQESSSSLEELSASSDEQSDTILTLTDMVKETEEKIMETNHIIDFIHGLSKQTTILGINASIEAARLGTAGKGFNVVANEVRKLADNTSDSVKKIDEVLKRIQASITNVSDNITTYTSTAQQQATVIQYLAKELENITGSVDTFLQKLS